MCRWLAYSGSPLRMSELLMQPNHSLLDQSRHARLNIETTNGDGFGLGWYGDHEEAPAVYRDTHPAWNDANLQHVAAHIQSPLFLAHVRAATGTPVQKTNCHPFNWRSWLFQHNGAIPEFRRLKRPLLFDVDPELFPYIEGSTDSEILFFLALTFGLEDDPPGALARTIGHVERARNAANVEAPVFFTACTTDGKRLWAVRYSSHDESRTLFHSNHIHAMHEIDGTYEVLPEGAVIVVSEPLDELPENWEAVPESSIVEVYEGSATVLPFAPL